MKDREEVWQEIISCEENFQIKLIFEGYICSQHKKSTEVVKLMSLSGRCWRAMCPDCQVNAIKQHRYSIEKKEPDDYKNFIIDSHIARCSEGDS